ncbi:LexA family protein (plasmid) [Microbulbifer sp. TRSA002]|uniref:LexA family protein n=1 Tax=Microbulbifer sp. TRSA002 TaxID=3243382 RepID=UPI004039EC4E
MPTTWITSDQQAGGDLYGSDEWGSMVGLRISDKDLLIIDRSLTPMHGDVVVVALDGQLTCKVLDQQQGRLLSANDDYAPIPIWEGQELIVEGVVKASVRYHRPR